MENAPDRIVIRIKADDAKEAMMWLYEHEEDKEAFRPGYEAALAQIEGNRFIAPGRHYNVAFPVGHRDMAMRFKLTWGGE